MSRLIDALLGAFGLIKRVRPINFDATWEKFVVSCKACQRPKEYVVSFVLVCDINPGFIAGGITGATHSAFSHAFTCLWENGDKVKDGYEIIESQETIKANSLLRYRNDFTQLVAFSVSLNKENLDKLKDNLYSQIGKPYDILEFIHYLKGIFGIFPNPTDLHVCSTLTTWGVKNVMHRWFGIYKKLRLVKNGIDPGNCVPGDIYIGCIPQFRLRLSKYLCK